jgi:S-adenosylmethionine-dependent methyltransferase
MSIPEHKTDTTAQAFVQYQRSVASRLRYGLAEANLRECHDLSRPLRAIDAAGGNGINAEFLLALGHHVTIYDADPEMLAQARARIEARGLQAQCRLVQGTLEDIADTLGGDHFDLILCHHVLEYIADGLRVLQGLHGLAAPHGELSLITLNPVSEVLRAVVFQRDPAQAAQKLADLSYDAKWFGTARLYPLEDILARADAAGWQLKEFRGMRVLADYVSEQEAQPREAELLRLETQLATLEPYRRIGRYLQFAFRRRAAGNHAR